MNRRLNLDKFQAGFKNTLRINIRDQMIKMVMELTVRLVMIIIIKIMIFTRIMVMVMIIIIKIMIVTRMVMVIKSESSSKYTFRLSSPPRVARQFVN